MPSARLRGTIARWNGERGFGFIEPDGEGPEIFVHIRAFGRNAPPPVVGDRVSFEIGVDKRDREQAVRVDYVESRVTSGAVPSRTPLRASTLGWVLAAIVAAVLAALAFSRW